MQTVRTIIWVVFAVLLTLFAVINSEIVAVRLIPGEQGTIAEVPLSLLIVAVFLLGFLPPYLVNKTNSWRLQRKIKQQDQTIALLRPTPAPVSTEVTPATPTPLSSTETTA
jgi:lipopolysaccharide assembly protein A